MALRVEDGFNPDSLTGYARTGLVVLDSENSIVLFNRALPRLLSVQADTLLGRALEYPGLLEWLESPGHQPHIVQSTFGPREFAILGRESGLSLLSVRDISDKIALQNHAQAFERSSSTDWHGFNARAKSVSVLQLFRDFAEHPQDMSNVMDMSRLTANVLFPLGGEVHVDLGKKGAYTWSWGVGAEDRAQLLEEGTILPLEKGSIVLAGTLEGVREEASDLFAKTLDFAIDNLEQ